jgi:hypothetical protein
MFRAGWRPGKLIVLRYDRLPGTKREIGTWIPSQSLRQRYKAHKHEAMMMFWPRQIRRRYPSLYTNVSTKLQALHPSAGHVLDCILGPARWTKYSDLVVQLSCSGLGDSRVRESLAEDDNKYVLFTGGGIVPSSLLSLKNITMLHVHPGVLPNIRGADGMLWSIFLRGKPGASCFIMAPDLDLGDILHRTEFELPAFGEANIGLPDGLMLYRTLFSYIDPLVRALAFQQLLDRSNGLNKMPAGRRQLPEEGELFHFMHPLLRDRALKRLFEAPTPTQAEL